jgi:hypothetical protein
MLVIGKEDAKRGMMSLVQTLYSFVLGSSFGILLLAGPALAEANVETNSLKNIDECVVEEGCIDQYLWSLYERTPKIDTVKVSEKKKMRVKARGRTRIITKTVTKFVTEDYTWKDPTAAKKAGMSLKDYVIGGMEHGFKLTLYRALRALDDAGLMPGITSAFRDDYRQLLATGYKACPNCSYHGGSRHGGYGHGLAADIVSVKGDSRSERCTSSEELWKWIDKHERDFGIGRPYLDRDPPHVAPIDGKEYADHRGRPNTQHADAKMKKHHRLALHNDRNVAKHTLSARPLKRSST